MVADEKRKEEKRRGADTYGAPPAGLVLFWPRGEEGLESVAVDDQGDRVRIVVLDLLVALEALLDVVLDRLVAGHVNRRKIGQSIILSIMTNETPRQV